jgi:hypothetical protein
MLCGPSSWRDRVPFFGLGLSVGWRTGWGETRSLVSNVVSSIHASDIHVWM